MGADRVMHGIDTARCPPGAGSEEVATPAVPAQRTSFRSRRPAGRVIDARLRPRLFPHLAANAATTVQSCPLTGDVAYVAATAVAAADVTVASGVWGTAQTCTRWGEGVVRASARERTE